MATSNADTRVAGYTRMDEGTLEDYALQQELAKPPHVDEGVPGEGLEVRDAGPHQPRLSRVHRREGVVRQAGREEAADRLEVRYLRHRGQASSVGASCSASDSVQRG